MPLARSVPSVWISSIDLPGEGVVLIPLVRHHAERAGATCGPLWATTVVFVVAPSQDKTGSVRRYAVSRV